MILWCSSTMQSATDMKRALLGILASVVVSAALIGCEFEPELTPMDWGETPQAPAFDIDPREQQVQEAIDAGDYQGAIELTIELYDLDTSYVVGTPTYAPDLEGVSITHEDGTVEIGGDFFSSPGLLATVIGHELVHTEQLANGRWYYDDQGIIMNEVEAYDWELANAAANGLSAAEIEEVEALRAAYFDLLTEENQELANQGIYVLPLPAAPAP